MKSLGRRQPCSGTVPKSYEDFAAGEGIGLEKVHKMVVCDLCEHSGTVTILVMAFKS